MLESIVAWSVQRRGLVLVLWMLIAVSAYVAMQKLSIDAVPDVTNTQVAIITSAPGLSPVEVEQYLTYPVETAMNGLPGVVEIRSVSRTAVSAVTVVFDDHVDVWFARQLVSERLKSAEADIPPEYGRPELAPVSTGLGEIYEFYLTSKKHSPMELRTLLDWVVCYKLRAVPGVVEVNAMGGEAKQYQVVLDRKRMAAHRLTLREIYEVLERNNASIGGGYIEKSGESYVIRGDSQFKKLDDIGNTVVASDEDGTPIFLKRIATIQIGPALRFGVVTKLGEGEIAAGTVMMLTGANSREVVHAVKDKLREIQAELPAGVEIRSYYDRAEFIDRMLKTVAVNLAEGAGLVVIVLFFTLGSFRGSIIAALAIPFSMAIAVIGMVRLRVTGNLMSLGAIDFGLLVDGAIVMLETTLFSLSLHRPRARDEIAKEVAAAMCRTARPVFFALLIILFVYLPLMTLEGVEGRMFRPMAITVALALFGALAFTLTAFPALAAYLLTVPKGKGTHDNEHGGAIFGRIARLYRRTLDFVLARPGTFFAGSLGFVGLAVIAGATLGAEFVPRLDEGELSLDVKRLPSISISEAQRLGVQVEEILSYFPEVFSVVTRTGRAEVATDPVGPDETEVMVKLLPKERWTSAHSLDELGELIKEAVEREVPATFVAVSQPIEDRVNQLLAGSRADVVVKVFGSDLTTLKSVADQIGKTLRDVPGQGDLRVQRVLGLPLLEIHPDRLRLARYGVPAKEVLEMVEASRVGLAAGRIFEGSRRFDLRLLLPPSTPTPEGFGDLQVSTPAGQLIPLAQVADITETEGPAVINREGLERRVLVEVNVRGRDLVSFVNEAQKRIASLTLPEGVRLKWGGQFENFSRASRRLGLVVPLALFAIFGLLFLMFGELRAAVAVFAGVPFALVGGIASLLMRGLPFSIPAAVGLIAVAGVSVLNGVVMASEVRRRLEQREARTSALIEGAISVLRPVLTTALVAGIGFLPMALSTRAGAEVQRPLATVVIGGIISSTILLLAILPILLGWLVKGENAASNPLPINQVV
jgi:cobalt-zinc-cadmium resistance protein CzcA